MEFLAWPGVVLILGLTVILVFKSHFGKFLDRTKRIGKDGIQAYDDAPQQQLTATTPTTPDALVKFLEGYHNPLLLEVETSIDDDLKERGLTNLTDINKALRKSLAGANVVLQFEKTDRVIWKSQIAALNYLNTRAGTPTKESELQGFFFAATVDYPKLYENRSFQQWLGFLGAHFLLREEEGIFITVRGREFLKWRVEEGRGGPYFG